MQSTATSTSLINPPSEPASSKHQPAFNQPQLASSKHQFAFNQPQPASNQPKSAINQPQPPPIVSPNRLQSCKKQILYLKAIEPNSGFNCSHNGCNCNHSRFNSKSPSEPKPTLIINQKPSREWMQTTKQPTGNPKVR